ncbi:translesion DNA synthesis-associated protein ImuA [Halomonas litopenaei]|uniref:translesion DNA synthesis-associated protein ImuA n=1 Tax=Halomonas litopenaei TaxID=2109328 RepID=UPI001A8DCA1D|nr:translesion DNA synthesis-associated protein ImuA [Halomonas litopenaei]MBN8413572.1 translesion DNA synthesis-associated protein ImuA [Halomonas litopenaei]
MTAAHPVDITQLMQRGTLWRAGRDPARDRETSQADVLVVPSGFATLDEVLGGGWPRGDLMEWLLDHPGIGEIRLLAPLMTRSQRIVLLDPPWIPHALALQAAGIGITKIHVIQTGTTKERLWAMEQVVKSGCCDLVLGWFGALQGSWLRRLQLAMAGGTGVGVLLRPASLGQQGSAAPWRLRLGGSANGRLEVEAFKRKGAIPAKTITLDLPTSSLSPVNRGAP